MCLETNELGVISAYVVIYGMPVITGYVGMNGDFMCSVLPIPGRYAS